MPSIKRRSGGNSVDGEESSQQEGGREQKGHHPHEEDGEKKKNAEAATKATMKSPSTSAMIVAAIFNSNNSSVGGDSVRQEGGRSTTIEGGGVASNSGSFHSRHSHQHRHHYQNPYVIMSPLHQHGSGVEGSGSGGGVWRRGSCDKSTEKAQNSAAADAGNPLLSGSGNDNGTANTTITNPTLQHIYSQQKALYDESVLALSEEEEEKAATTTSSSNETFCCGQKDGHNDDPNRTNDGHDCGDRIHHNHDDRNLGEIADEDDVAATGSGRTAVVSTTDGNAVEEVSSDNKHHHRPSPRNASLTSNNKSHVSNSTTATSAARRKSLLTPNTSLQGIVQGVVLSVFESAGVLMRLKGEDEAATDSDDDDDEYQDNTGEGNAISSDAGHGHPAEDVTSIHEAEGEAEGGRRRASLLIGRHVEEGGEGEGNNADRRTTPTATTLLNPPSAVANREELSEEVSQTNEEVTTTDGVHTDDDGKGSDRTTALPLIPASPPQLGGTVANNGNGKGGEAQVTASPLASAATTGGPAVVVGQPGGAVMMGATNTSTTTTTNTTTVSICVHRPRGVLNRVEATKPSSASVGNNNFVLRNNKPLPPLHHGQQKPFVPAMASPRQRRDAPPPPPPLTSSSSTAVLPSLSLVGNAKGKASPSAVLGSQQGENEPLFVISSPQPRLSLSARLHSEKEKTDVSTTTLPAITTPRGIGDRNATRGSLLLPSSPSLPRPAPPPPPSVVVANAFMSKAPLITRVGGGHQGQHELSREEEEAILLRLAHRPPVVSVPTATTTTNQPALHITGAAPPPLSIVEGSSGNSRKPLTNAPAVAVMTSSRHVPKPPPLPPANPLAKPGDERARDKGNNSDDDDDDDEKEAIRSARQHEYKKAFDAYWEREAQSRAQREKQALLGAERRLLLQQQQQGGSIQPSLPPINASSPRRLLPTQQQSLITGMFGGTSIETLRNEGGGVLTQQHPHDRVLAEKAKKAQIYATLKNFNRELDRRKRETKENTAQTSSPKGGEEKEVGDTGKEDVGNSITSQTTRRSVEQILAFAAASASTTTTTTPRARAGGGGKAEKRRGSQAPVTELLDTPPLLSNRDAMERKKKADDYFLSNPRFNPSRIVEGDAKAVNEYLHYLDQISADLEREEANRRRREQSQKRV